MTEALFNRIGDLQILLIISSQAPSVVLPFEIVGSLRNHDGGAEDNVDWKINLTYESRDTLKSFTLFISAKAVTKLSLGHIDKSEIKI